MLRDANTSVSDSELSDSTRTSLPSADVAELLANKPTCISKGCEEGTSSVSLSSSLSPASLPSSLLVYIAN